MHVATIYGDSWKELIGKKTEFISQWIKSKPFISTQFE